MYILTLMNNIDFGIVTAGYTPRGISVDCLKKARWVRCSLDAVDPYLYKKIRGGLKSFKMVEDSIKGMIEKNINIGLGITIHSLNWDHVPKIFEFAIKNNIKEIRVWMIREHSSMDIPQGAKIDVIKIFEKYSKRLDTFNINHNLTSSINDKQIGMKTGHCFACLYQLFIDAYGNIYPCCTLAGDTESAPRTKKHCWGNINQISTERKWKNIWHKHIVPFSNKDVKKLPNICKHECIARHVIANNIAFEKWKERSFQ